MAKKYDFSNKVSRETQLINVTVDWWRSVVLAPAVHGQMFKILFWAHRLPCLTGSQDALQSTADGCFSHRGCSYCLILSITEWSPVCPSGCFLKDGLSKEADKPESTLCCSKVWLGRKST